jgi:hypothetical protein
LDFPKGARLVLGLRDSLVEILKIQNFKPYYIMQREVFMSTADRREGVRGTFLVFWQSKLMIEEHL